MNNNKEKSYSWKACGIIYFFDFKIIEREKVIEKKLYSALTKKKELKKTYTWHTHFLTMRIFVKNICVLLYFLYTLGASRGFAFVEFNTEQEATRWMEYKQVPLYHTKQPKKKEQTNARGKSVQNFLDA